MVTDAVIPVEKCKPHERNYNAHSEAQIKDLAESLRQFGQVRSIVVQAQKGKTFLLVAGHGIWLAAKKAGLKELRANVIPASWSKTKVLAYLAADNELSRRGSPDEEQLAAIVRDVCEAEGEVMAALAAGERAALDAILAIEAGDADAEPQTDRAEELRDKWGTELGQLWAIGPHRLLCGDSTRREDVERVMNGEIAELAAVDPPYNVGFDYDGETVDDKKSAEKYEEFSRAWFGECQRVSKKQIVTPGGINHIFWAVNFPAIHCGAWIKTNAMTRGRVSNSWCWEPVFFHGAKFGNKRANDVFNYPIGQQKDTANHPCPKPLKMWGDLIENYSEPGAVVFESFGGSGTTLVACQNLGRVCRAIELSPAYCAVILERMITAFPTLDIYKVD